MEKIYMENFNNKKSKTILKGRGILITSLLMVIVAVAAFVTAGFGSVSYALPDEFDTVDPEVSIVSDTGFVVNPYYTSTGAQVYCIDNSVDFVGNAHYQNAGKIEDYGLMYLIANGYPTKSVLGGVTTGDQTKDKYANIWVMQTAIWVYQYVKGAPLSHAEYLINGTFKTISKLTLQDDSGEYNPQNDITLTDVNFSSIVRALVVDALSHDYSESLFELSATGNAKEEGDYFISGPIKVNSAGSLQSFTVKITSDVKDAQIIDSNGTVIKPDDELTSATNVVYVKVPKKSLSEGETKINLLSNATFSSLGAYMYTGEYTDNQGAKHEAQTLADVYPTTAEFSSTATIKFKVVVDVPDTGMTTAHTIYFIGLVVLLCGVGIVYANVKPKEAE